MSGLRRSAGVDRYEALSPYFSRYSSICLAVCAAISPGEADLAELGPAHLAVAIDVGAARCSGRDGGVDHDHHVELRGTSPARHEETAAAGPEDEADEGMLDRDENGCRRKIA